MQVSRDVRTLNAMMLYTYMIHQNHCMAVAAKQIGESYNERTKDKKGKHDLRSPCSKRGFANFAR